MADPTPTESVDLSEMLNSNLDGWNSAMGVRFVKATADEVIAEVELGPVHLQAYGIVHGGLHSGLIETVASVGAALHAAKHDQSAVGLENSTSFLHAVRGGTLRATARPLTRGRRSQVWEATVADGTGRIAATGRVRLLCLDREVSLAGESVTLRPGEPPVR